MLTELSATNFKSWPRLGPMRLAPLTGLFGTNSSGKSSLIVDTLYPAAARTLNGARVIAGPRLVIVLMV
jgi:predicted ATPase